MFHPHDRRGDDGDIPHSRATSRGGEHPLGRNRQRLSWRRQDGRRRLRSVCQSHSYTSYFVCSPSRICFLMRNGTHYPMYGQASMFQSREGL